VFDGLEYINNLKLKKKYFMFVILVSSRVSKMVV
jgi:hypothetical protein